MNSDQDSGLDDFVLRFLEHQGAVVETGSDGWEVLLPETLSSRLDTPDYLRIPINQDRSEAENDYSISFGSPLVEKMVDMACSRVPVAVCELSFDYLKSQGFVRLIREHIRFPGAVGRVESSGKAKTSYLLVSCRYLAQSDEQKEGLIELLFNYDTGAFVGREKIDLVGISRDYQDSFPVSWDPEQMNRISASIKAQIRDMLAVEIQPFKESMIRRFRRDVRNLDEYYGALKKEMENSLSRPGLSRDALEERRKKIALLPDELMRKKDDLFKKYSITIKVRPCAAMLIRMPTITVRYRVTAGRQEKGVSLTYNPLTRAIEPLVCQGCGRSMSTVYRCDQWHFLCFDCRHQCPVC